MRERERERDAPAAATRCGLRLKLLRRTRPRRSPSSSSPSVLPSASALAASSSRRCRSLIVSSSKLSVLRLRRCLAAAPSLVVRLTRCSSSMRGTGGGRSRRASSSPTPSLARGLYSPRRRLARRVGRPLGAPPTPPRLAPAPELDPPPAESDVRRASASGRVCSRMKALNSAGASSGWSDAGSQKLAGDEASSSDSADDDDGDEKLEWGNWRVGEGTGGGAGSGCSEGRRPPTVERRRTRVPVSAGEGAVGETGPPPGCSLMVGMASVRLGRLIGGEDVGGGVGGRSGSATGWLIERRRSSMSVSICEQKACVSIQRLDQALQLRLAGAAGHAGRGDDRRTSARSSCALISSPACSYAPEWPCSLDVLRPTRASSAAARSRLRVR